MPPPPPELGVTLWWGLCVHHREGAANVELELAGDFGGCLAKSSQAEICACGLSANPRAVR